MYVLATSMLVRVRSQLVLGKLGGLGGDSQGDHLKEGVALECCLSCSFSEFGLSDFFRHIVTPGSHFPWT
jgi:hypothetical protein